MTTQTEVLPHETVWTITNAAVSARALHLVADLGVADRMEDATVTVDDLARRCGANADALDRVLSLLVLNGIFVRAPQGYSHNDASRLLRSDHPTSMRAFARMMGLPIFWSSFGALEDSLRTGTPSLQSVHAEGLWAYLRDHPDEAQIFNDAMQAKATADLAAVLGSYDFRPSPQSPTSVVARATCSVPSSTPYPRSTVFSSTCLGSSSHCHRSRPG